VDIKHPKECWNWLASCGTPGYGNWYYSIFDLPKAGAAHRRSYMLFNGYVDSSVVICHTCNNRRCCNPNHLYAGTHASNTADRIKDGTASKPPLHLGSKQWNSRLVECQVIEIKERLRAGEIPPRIAPDYNVKPATIYEYAVEAAGVGFSRNCHRQDY
jgi:hypothetical protein